MIRTPPTQGRSTSPNWNNMITAIVGIFHRSWGSKNKRFPNPRCTFSHKKPQIKRGWKKNHHNLEKIYLEVRKLLSNLLFFRTTAFTIKITFKPFHLNAPKYRWHIYIHLDQILDGSEKSAIPWTQHPWHHLLIIPGLLPDSWWTHPFWRQGLEAFHCSCSRGLQYCQAQLLLAVVGTIDKSNTSHAWMTNESNPEQLLVFKSHKPGPQVGRSTSPIQNNSFFLRLQAGTIHQSNTFHAWTIQ